MKTLHLVLKHKWYEKIASGEKTSEYRECKPYWNKKFAGGEHILVPAALFMPMKFEQKTEYKTVIFHKGYTNETMEFEINGLFLIQNIPNDLNLPCCWEIKLGGKIKMKIQELLPRLKKGWMAMDVDGSWYWYKRKPYYNLRNGCWSISPADSFPCRLPREALPIEFDGNWKDSLMKCGEKK